jgi:hypothetical protein
MTMSWRPLSKRGVANPLLDEPAEGMPPWLVRPVFGWVVDLIVDRDPSGFDAPSVRDDLLNDMAIKLRFQQPLDFSNRTSASDELLDRMRADNELAFDVLDYLLGHLHFAADNRGFPPNIADELATVLTDGGSVWEVAEVEGVWALQRRSVGPIRDAIASASPATRAGQHLTTAWNRLVGRSPDPSSAYREAVRAVEAVARPTILPNNDRATLGTMIAAMRDKPEKWTTTLGTVDEVRQMMEMLWTNQLDRHGTDDEEVPLNVTSDQADVAVYLALTLTRLFAGAHVLRRAE